ncbi:MAG: hypothetical protein LBO62_04405 [Endomicrobium sp.]|nr:hypothetical protein [Endomicrobium sp.]
MLCKNFVLLPLLGSVRIKTPYNWAFITELPLTVCQKKERIETQILYKIYRKYRKKHTTSSSQMRSKNLTADTERDPEIDTEIDPETSSG